MSSPQIFDCDDYPHLALLERTGGNNNVRLTGWRIRVGNQINLPDKELGEFSGDGSARLQESGIGTDPSRFISAYQKSNLNERDDNQSASKYRQYERKKSYSIMRRPLPEDIKWIILSGFLIGIIGTGLIAAIFGWLR